MDHLPNAVRKGRRLGGKIIGLVPNNLGSAQGSPGVSGRSQQTVSVKGQRGTVLALGGWTVSGSCSARRWSMDAAGGRAEASEWDSAVNSVGMM